jgi:hypothetical protein
MAEIRQCTQAISDRYPRWVETLRSGMKKRNQAEWFVSACFNRHYGAEIRHFMPLLMSLRDQQQRLRGILGFCRVGQAPLFLENYLDQPAEQLLTAKLKRPVDRRRLVEVSWAPSRWSSRRKNSSSGQRPLIQMCSTDRSTLHSVASITRCPAGQSAVGMMKRLSTT